MIRKADVLDSSAIANVHVQAWRAAYSGIIDGAYLESLSPSNKEKEWENYFDLGVIAWVAIINDNIIGFVSICPSRDKGDNSDICAEISAIYVLPEYWEQGYGKKLFTTATDYLVSHNYKEIIVWVAENNVRARDFYEKNKFTLLEEGQIDKVGKQEIKCIKYKKKI